MDNLYSGLHEVVLHSDHAEIDFGGTASSRRAQAPKRTAEPTSAGSGWYHDAAIDAARAEAIEARSNPYHR